MCWAMQIPTPTMLFEAAEFRTDDDKDRVLVFKQSSKQKQVTNRKLWLVQQTLSMAAG